MSTRQSAKKKKAPAAADVFHLARGAAVAAWKEEGEAWEIDGYESDATLTQEELISLLTTHEYRDNKDGAYITRPMPGGDHSRSDSNAGASKLVPVDIDELQPDEVPLLKKWFADSNLKGSLSTTFSHRPDRPKYRMMLVASREITAEEHAFIHRALESMVPFKLDPCMAKPSQPIFLPSCPPDQAKHAFAEYRDGEALDVDRLLSVYQKDIEEQTQRRAQAGHEARGIGVRTPGGVVDWINTNLDLPALLIDAGYKRKSKNRFTAPGSKSGRAAVVLCQGKRAVVSFHEPDHDLLAVRNKQGQAVVLDAFAAFCKLKHNDDFKAAFADALQIAKAGGYDPNEALPDASSSDSDWEEPQPLVSKLAPEDYPLDAHPPSIRDAVMEVQGFVKAPIPLVAASALTAISLAVQALFDVRRAPTLSGPVSLFFLTIAESGERKSTCDAYFTPTIRDYEKQQASAKQPDLEAYRTEVEIWNAKRTGLSGAIRDGTKKNGPNTTKKQEQELLKHEATKPLEPRVPKLLLGDATPEHVSFTLAHHWPSGGIISSEAGAIFGAYGMGADSLMRYLALLNVLWEGGEQDVGRRTSESYTLRGARLTVGLQVQEPTLKAFFDKSAGLARGSGFLARFLVAVPNSTQGERPFTDPPVTWPALASFNKRIAEILSIDPTIDNQTGALEPEMLLLAGRAKALWREFHDSVESDLGAGGVLQDVRDVASKAADNCARLAALFHVFTSKSNGTQGLGVPRNIDPEHVESAARIVRWHMNESRRFFGELALPAEVLNAARLDHWLVEYCRRKKTHLVPIGEVQQFGPGSLRKTAVITDTVRELENADRARMVRDGKRKFIAVNPALLR